MNCGVIVTRRTNKKLCAACFTGKDIREVLLFTVKQWKIIEVEKQMFILKIYEVILTDWKSKREKLKYFLDTYPQYLDKGFKKMDKGFKMFDTMMAEFDKGLKGSMGSSKIDTSFIVGKAKKTDYSSLVFGSKNKKTQLF